MNVKIFKDFTDSASFIAVLDDKVIYSQIRKKLSFKSVVFIKVKSLKIKK
ncbi:MAG: hypothetical protein QXD43_00535 [Candidatus Aenigmatarchaeota archaeon]